MAQSRRWALLAAAAVLGASSAALAATNSPATHSSTKHPVRCSRSTCTRPAKTVTLTKTVTVTRTVTLGPSSSTSAAAPVSSTSAAPSSSHATTTPATSAATSTSARSSSASSSTSSSSAASSTSSSPAPPTQSGFPNSGNTGASSASLKTIPGDVTQGPGWHYDSRGWIEIDGNGAVFSGYQTSVNVDVTASNVTIRNNVISMTGTDWGISLRHSTGDVIDHNTIHGQSQSNECDSGIRDIYGDSDRVAITANNIYYCGTGINHFDAGGQISDNYIHDLGFVCAANAGPDCGHFNGIQLGSGYGPLMTINHNTILVPAPTTDCIMLANDDGAETNRTITNNLLGGGGYSFYGSGWDGASATHISFTGNKFTTRYYPQSGSYGPVAHWSAGGAGNVWSNNTWADGPHAGQAITP